MFLRTVSQGKRAYCWKTTPRSPLGPFTGLLSTSTSPSVCLSKPARMFRRVDFPQPEGPTTQMNSLSRISRSTPFRATTSPEAPW